MQPTPRRTRVVMAAKADNNVTDSKRGLARRLSPTQMVSNAPEASPCVAKSKRSRTVTAPRITARLGRMSPKETVIAFPQLIGRSIACCGLSASIFDRGLSGSTLSPVQRRARSHRSESPKRGWALPRWHGPRASMRSRRGSKVWSAYVLRRASETMSSPEMGRELTDDGHQSTILSEGQKSDEC